MAALLLVAPSGAEPGTHDLTALSLEQLLGVEVYAASRHGEMRSEAPAAVSVVTAQDIRRHGYRTLADILRSVPGLYVTDDRNYSYVGARGFARPGDYSTRVLLLVDGLRMNDAIYDMAFVGAEFPVDTELIDRVEVVHGPAAAIYGNNALFAVVNVVTRRGADVAGAELTAAAGSWGSYRGRATYGRRFASGWDVVASASGFDSDGQDLYYSEFDRPETGDGFVRNADDERAESALVAVSKGGTRLQAAHVSREKGIPTASYGTVFGDSRTRTTDTRSFVALESELTLGEETSLLSRVHYGRYDYQGTYVYTPEEGGDSLDYALGEWWGAEAYLTSSISRRHRLQLGGEFEDRFRQDQGGRYPTAPELDFAIDEHSSRWGVFAQDEWRISDLLVGRIALRYDHFGEFGQKTSPRLALVASPDPRTRIKLLYGQAFRAPNAYELRYYGDNPTLGTENVRTAELVAERTFRGRLRVTASAFATRIEDLVTLEGDQDSLHFENSGRIDSKGVEIGGEARFDELTARLSYAFQRSRESGLGADLSNSPRHLVKVALGLPLTPRLQGGLDLQYTSRRYTLSGARTPGFVLTNLTLSVPRIAGRFDASVSLYNLFDVTHWDPASAEHTQDAIGQNGRSFRVKLGYRF